MPFLPAPNFRTRWNVPVASGPFWIAIGLLWLGFAQMCGGLPIASAVAAIGYGALMHARRMADEKERKCRLSPADVALASMGPLFHRLIYLGLVGLTIAAQWDLALRSPAGRLGPVMTWDHLLALGILFRLFHRSA